MGNGQENKGGGNALSNGIISGELPDRTAIFDATGYQGHVDGVEGQDNAGEESEFLDPSFLEEILEAFDDSGGDSSMFTADAGIMGDKSADGPVLKKFSARHRCPTLQLEPIDLIDDSVKIRQLHHIDDLRKEHSIIDPRRGYVLGDDFSEFCVIPGEKPIYDGKGYAKKFIESIKPEINLSKFNDFKKNIEKRIHHIADRIHNIPYVSLRVYNDVKVNEGYRLEFAVLRKGKGYLKGKTRLDDFVYKMGNTMPSNNKVVEFNEIKYDDAIIAQHVTENLEEFNRVLNMLLRHELLSDYSDSLRKIHPDADLAVKAEIHIDEKKIRISGVDSKQEALFELKFHLNETGEKDTLDQMDKFIRLLAFYFQ